MVPRAAACVGFEACRKEAQAIEMVRAFGMKVHRFHNLPHWFGSFRFHIGFTPVLDCYGLLTFAHLLCISLYLLVLASHGNASSLPSMILYAPPAGCSSICSGQQAHF